MKGYKDLMKEQVQRFKRAKMPPAEQRAKLRKWKERYHAEHSGVNNPNKRPYEGKKDVNIIHGGAFDPVIKTSGKRAKPKITPYELDPDYKDPKEKVHGDEDLEGVKQYPVTLEEEPQYDTPDFSGIKSARLRRSVEILQLKIGYDHTTNMHVLYSPMKYNEKWDNQSKAVWLRTIGMTPKRIGVKLDVKYDTVKNWLRSLKGQPLVYATQHDWAMRQVDNADQLMTKFSGIEAKGRSTEVLQDVRLQDADRSV